MAVIYLPHPILIAIFGAISLWKAWQFRRNRDAALLAVVGACFFIAAGFAFGDVAKRCHAACTFKPTEYLLTGTVILDMSKYCTAAFFVFASQRPSAIRRILALTSLPLLASIIVMSAATLESSPSATPYQFQYPSIVAFFVGEKLFNLPIDIVIVGYGFVYLRLLSGTAARGIALSVLGATLIFAAETTFMTELIYYASSARPPSTLIASGRWEVYSGELIFAFGVSWYGLVMRARVLATSIVAIRDIVLVRRLWRLLAMTLGEFVPTRRLPEFRPNRPVTSVLERRHAMMVDIRDGLMVLSPQMDPECTTIRDYATEIQRVAHANQRRPVLYGEPVRSMVDRVSTFDADRALLTGLGVLFDRRRRTQLPHPTAAFIEGIQT